MATSPPADLLSRALQLHQEGQRADARPLYEALLADHPAHADAWYLLGVLHMQDGRAGDAAGALRCALASMDPAAPAASQAKARMALGGALEATGDLAGARDAYAAAAAQDAWTAAPHVKLGTLRRSLGDAPGAVTAWREALRRDPADAATWGNLAVVLRRQGDASAAEEAFNAAIARRPEDPDLAAAFADLLADQARDDEAETLCRRALERGPYRLDALVMLTNLARRSGDFGHAEAAHQRLVGALARAVQEHRLGQEDVRTLARVLYADLMGALPRPLWRATASALDAGLRARAGTVPDAVPRPGQPGARLRVGYLSEFLGAHPVGHVIAGLFQAHDRDRLEVHVLNARPGGPDGSVYDREIQAGADRVHAVGGLGSADLARQVAGLDLDVLVALDGVMGGATLDVLGYRVARRQLFWLGHAGTLPLHGVDATLADDRVLPTAERLADEPILALPGCYHVASPHPIAPEAPQRAACGLPERGFVFCVFNNPQKIDRRAFQAWMAVLKAVPDSVLWLSTLGRAPRLAAGFAAQATAAGVDPRRLVYAEPMPDKRLHLARLAHAGLLLDTFTLNASTTALDALWAGVPVLTLRGERWHARIAASFLAELGFSELICPSVDAYVERAAALARDPAALARLRSALRDALLTAPLFDLSRFAAKLEDAYAQLSAP